VSQLSTLCCIRHLWVICHRRSASTSSCPHPSMNRVGIEVAGQQAMKSAVWGTVAASSAAAAAARLVNDLDRPKGSSNRLRDLLRDRDLDRLPPRDVFPPFSPDEEVEEAAVAFKSAAEELEGAASAMTALMGLAARERAASHFSKEAWSGHARRHSCPLLSLPPLPLLAAAAAGGVTMSKKVVGGGVFIHKRRVSRLGCVTVQPSRLKVTSLERVL